MLADERLEQIVALTEDRGFISVKELSKLHNVSEVTIRRDLQRLEEEQRLRRTYGGAVPWRAGPAENLKASQTHFSGPSLEGFLTDRVDVLISTAFDPRSDRLLMERTEQRHVPVIAESVALAGAKTLVAVDNYRAAVALGRWAGEYARENFGGQANVLDLTFHLSNTQVRSQGFVAGLREVLPHFQMVLSIDAQSGWQTAYQLTTDALHVYPHINVIFAINDATAWGAIRACQDLGLDPEGLLVLTFGMEGNTLRNALMAGQYCKAGLAMFPEIVSRVCVEAAIQAYYRRPLPEHLVTPYTILTAETLPSFYRPVEKDWEIRWETVCQQLSIPLEIDLTGSRDIEQPQRIGFVVPFSEHEWYKNLITCMQAHTQLHKIELEVIDAAQNLKDEVATRKRGIALVAAEQIRPGDVVLIDGGQITTYLAEALVEKENITVITNSVAVFDILRDQPNITLILTGGLLRHASDTLTGPTAEAALRELRADKLFLAVAGVSLDFGLSHTHLAEVAMKQAMIRAAREVILLADHTKFGRETMVQVAPTGAVHKLVTDNALPASIRLDLTKLGIKIILAKS